MAGIYLHVPFCKQACHYCDFHFSTNTSRKSEMVAAMLKELSMRQEEVAGEQIETIYFGGGTPSLLSQAELESLITTINDLFLVSPSAEITLEANPDDLGKEKLHQIKQSEVNRLSIGIQTFDDNRLQYMNRAHSKSEAVECLENARNTGFDNISADLIYAIPPDDMDYWYSDLQTLLSFGLEHISLYGLTVEEKTVFGNWHKKGKLVEVGEELAAQQYEMAIDTLKSSGYEHYEVSNFCKANFHSRHNTGYWENKKYLGIGPGAHSYDGVHRSFNISNNALYLKSLHNGQLSLTVEQLSDIDRLNDYIFTHLRTNKGLNYRTLFHKFNVDLVGDHQSLIDTWVVEGLMTHDDSTLTLTSKGFMIADEITWRLFYE